MACSNCGSEIAPDARFCGSCGQPTRTHADERRVVSVLFADIVGFTSLTEHLDPERVKALVDMAFERLVRDVNDFGGRVDKIVGDAIVALFGAPVAHEDDAERAVRAALRMHQTLAHFAAESGIEIRMRIGVNTGEVLVGALRVGGDYTAMGDVVNTASRLEASANPGEVLVGAATFNATSEVIGYEPRGSVMVRGREAAVDVWAATEALMAPGHRPRRFAPLVGRDTELTLLRSSVELSVKHRRAQLILLLGEAGVGKTRLANEIAPMMLELEPNAIVATGRCVPYGEANPWFPLGEALREACQIDADDSHELALKKCTFSTTAVISDAATQRLVIDGLMHMMGLDGPLRVAQTSRARAEATAGLIAFMEAWLKIQPVVVRLADLHWADTLVLELIDQLADRFAREPLTFVASSRRVLLERWAPKTGRENLLILNLAPLDREASGALLNSLLESNVSEDVREMLLDRSGGNPFYLEELATLLSGRAEAQNPDERADVPDTLRGLIAARIDGLSAAEQLTLEDASVWGATGAMEVLRRISQALHQDVEIEKTVASLALKDVFVLDGDVWSFRSDLIREITYSRLTKSERLRRHRGIATYLESAGGGRFLDDDFVDTVSRHFAEAAGIARELSPLEGSDVSYLIDRALVWLGEGARRADTAAAWSSSIRLYTRAISLASGDMFATRRLQFLVGRAMAESSQWNFTAARVDAHEIAALVEEMDDEVGRARLQLLLGEIESREGNYAESLEHYDRAIAAFGALDDVYGCGEALRLKGMAALYRGDVATAESPIVDSLTVFRDAGDRRGEAWALQNLAWISFMSGSAADAEDLLHDALAIFEDLGDLSGQAWTDGLSAFVRFYQGRFAEASEIATRVLEDGKRRNDRWAQSMMMTVLAGIDLWEGRPEQAFILANSASEMLVDLGDPVGKQRAWAIAGRAQVMMGEVVAGLKMIDDSLFHASDMNQSLDLDPESIDGAIAGSGSSSVVDVGEASVEYLMGQTASVATRVQLGIAQRLDIDAIAASFNGQSGGLPADLVTAVALAMAQCGRYEEAIEVLNHLRREDRSERSVAYAESGRMLILAAHGNTAEVAKSAHQAEDGATFLDQVMNRIALGLCAGPDWEQCFADAAKEAAASPDVLTTAIVYLARACTAEAMKHPDAEQWRTQALGSWRALEVDPVGWQRMFTDAHASAPVGH